MRLQKHSKGSKATTNDMEPDIPDCVPENNKGSKAEDLKNLIWFHEFTLLCQDTTIYIQRNLTSLIVWC